MALKYGPQRLRKEWEKAEKKRVRGINLKPWRAPKIKGPAKSRKLDPAEK
jgi:hypothetical protein